MNDGRALMRVVLRRWLGPDKGTEEDEQEQAVWSGCEWRNNRGK